MGEGFPSCKAGLSVDRERQVLVCHPLNGLSEQDLEHVKPNGHGREGRGEKQGLCPMQVHIRAVGPKWPVELFAGSWLSIVDGPPERRASPTTSPCAGSNCPPNGLSRNP